MIRCLFGGRSGWKCWSLLPCVFFCVSLCIFQWILYSSEDMWSLESVVYYRIYNMDYRVLTVQLVNIDIGGRFDKKISGWWKQYVSLETKNVILDHSFLWFTHLFKRQIPQSNLSRYIFITANLRFFSATAEQEIRHMDIGSSSPKRLDFPEITYLFFPVLVTANNCYCQDHYQTYSFDLFCSLHSWIFLLPSFLHFIPALKVKAVLQIRTRKEQKKFS